MLEGFHLYTRSRMAQRSESKLRAFAAERMTVDSERPRITPPFERTYESELATRIAMVKVILAFFNIAVVIVDNTVLDGTSTPSIGSFSIVLIFLGYMLFS